jgi:hypothetical protein
MHVFSHRSNIDHIHDNQEFNSSLDRLLEQYYLTQPVYAEYTQGKSITTCADHELVYKIQGFDMVIRWLEHSLSCFFGQRHVQNFQYQVIRSWCNRIYYGVSGKVHNHWSNIPNTLSVVLYYQTPTDSSKYVVIDHNEKRPCYTDYDIDDLIFFEPNTGLAIIHDSRIYHDVTEHQNQSPRTVFVFDIEYKI